MFYSTKFSSPIGMLTVACGEDKKNIVGLWMEGSRHFGLPEMKAADETIPLLEKAKKWLENYFAGKKPAVSALPLAPEGSEFRKTVWGILAEIPYGKTAAYGEVAERAAKLLGRKTSARAVGNAVGHNPISVIIPCHRVVGADGSLTGFGGGIDRKIKLLEMEGADMSRLYKPF